MQENEQIAIFRQWLQQHQALLFKVVRAFASDDHQDDLFQEIAIQVWHSIPNFRKESAVTTWLYRVSLNTAITWNKKERKHQQGRQPMEAMEHLLQANQQPGDPRLIWLYEEIGKLNEIDRSVTLLLLDGFSYKEIALILGISQSNVGVKINRIKKLLIVKSKKYDYHGV